MLDTDLVRELSSISMWGGRIHTDTVDGLLDVLERQGLTPAYAKWQLMPKGMPKIVQDLVNEGRLIQRYSNEDGSTNLLILEPHPYARHLGFKSRVAFFDKKHNSEIIYRLVEALFNEGYHSRN